MRSKLLVCLTLQKSDSPNAAAVDTLWTFKFLDSDEIIKSLKSEVPTYLAPADGVALTVDPLVWWERQAELIPQQVLFLYAKAYKKVLLCQPSSAAVKRVFSVVSMHS